MILEGVVTTLNEDGSVNIAPMGPRMDPGATRFTLRPFRASNTCRNLLRSREGVLHVTDDVLLLARAAIGKEVSAATRAAEFVEGRVLEDCCRYLEFRVVEIDESLERVRLEAESLLERKVRDFYGFNRAKHSVLEVAILATRVAILDRDEILKDVLRHRVIVEKTGGPEESEALKLLQSYIESAGPG